MSAQDDGGPAFPRALPPDTVLTPAQLQQIIARYDGMSLRDYFAAKALMALDVQAHVARPAAENLAKSAYEVADAMLKARQP